MAQFARPNADTLRDNWEEDDGTTTNIFSEIDESVVDDADFVRTVLSPTDDVYVCKFSSVTDPVTAGGHIVRYRIAKDASDDGQVNLVVELRMGYTNESSKGTLVHTWTHVNIDNVPTTYTQTLSSAEANSISNYASLYLRFSANQIVPLAGTTYFSSNAESTVIVPPWSFETHGNGGNVVVASTVDKKNGTYSWLHKTPSAGAGTNGHYSQLFAGTPTLGMGGASGHFATGYYSWWMKVVSGYTLPDWQLTLGFMTGTGSAPRPMSDIGLRLPIADSPQVLQLMYHLSSATDPDAGFANTAPAITNYRNVSNGYYFMTATSPAGIKAFPRNQWVHVCVYFLMAATNGRVTIWQDGTKIMDLTAPTLNTLRGAQGSNPAGDMYLQFGMYSAPQTGDQVMYSDDFLVTDYQVVP